MVCVREKGEGEREYHCILCELSSRSHFLISVPKALQAVADPGAPKPKKGRTQLTSHRRCGRGRAKVSFLVLIVTSYVIVQFLRFT